MRGCQLCKNLMQSTYYREQAEAPAARYAALSAVGKVDFLQRATKL